MTVLGRDGQVTWDMMEQGEQKQPPLLWSAEEPHLYVLVLSVLSPSGEVIEAESTQVCPPPIPLSITVRVPLGCSRKRHNSGRLCQCSAWRVDFRQFVNRDRASPSG